VYNAPSTMMWCRRRCPQPQMGRFRRFRHNRFVLWTYWDRRVARFRRPRWGRQSEHGRRSGDSGGQLRDMLVLAGTQCGTHDSREGDTERPVSFRMMVEA